VGRDEGGGTAEGARRKNDDHGAKTARQTKRIRLRAKTTRARSGEVGDETGLVRFWFRLGQSHVPGALSPIITGDPVAATTYTRDTIIADIAPTWYTDSLSAGPAGGLTIFKF